MEVTRNQNGSFTIQASEEEYRAMRYSIASTLHREQEELRFTYGSPPEADEIEWCQRIRSIGTALRRGYE